MKMKEKKGEVMEEPKPGFLTVYLQNSCADHMELPIAFNRFLANPLPRAVTIRTRTGNVWTMALRRVNGKVAFEKDWKKFIQDNDVKFRDLLVFEYDHSQLFDVSIFGVSACQKIRCLFDAEDIIEDGEDGEGENDVDKEEGDKVEEEEEEEDHDVDNYDADTDDENEQSVEYGAGDREEMGMEGLKRKKTLLEEKRNRTPARKQKGVCGGSLPEDKDEQRTYLDDPMNPFFATKLMNKNITILHIPSSLIKDYDLKFPDVITFVDPLGKLVRKVNKVENRNVNIYGFKSIYNRNWVKRKDAIICELLKENNGWVHTIKVHIIRG